MINIEAIQMVYQPKSLLDQALKKVKSELGNNLDASALNGLPAETQEQILDTKNEFNFLLLLQHMDQIDPQFHDKIYQELFLDKNTFFHLIPVLSNLNKFAPDVTHRILVEMERKYAWLDKPIHQNWPDFFIEKVKDELKGSAIIAEIMESCNAYDRSNNCTIKNIFNDYINTPVYLTKTIIKGIQLYKNEVDKELGKELIRNNLIGVVSPILGSAQALYFSKYIYDAYLHCAGCIQQYIVTGGVMEGLTLLAGATSVIIPILAKRNWNNYLKDRYRLVETLENAEAFLNVHLKNNFKDIRHKVPSMQWDELQFFNIGLYNQLGDPPHA